MGNTTDRQGPYNAPPRHPGLRGRALAKLREREGVGQSHLAQAMNLSQPELSMMERERFGGMPRGFSSRYQDAIERAKATEHFKHCGCKGLASVRTEPGTRIVDVRADTR